MLDSARARLWLRRAFVAAALLAAVMALLPKPPNLPLQPGDKLQHMTAFFVLGALAAAGWRERSAMVLFAWLAVFGGAIEVFQGLPVVNRTPDPWDWVADMAAVVVALVGSRIALPRLP